MDTSEDEAVRIKRYENKIDIEIIPSKKGTIAGTSAGLAAGARIAGPVGSVIGGAIGGSLGLIFGPED